LRRNYRFEYSRAAVTAAAVTTDSHAPPSLKIFKTRAEKNRRAGESEGYTALLLVVTSRVDPPEICLLRLGRDTGARGLSIAPTGGRNRENAIFMSARHTNIVMPDRRCLDRHRRPGHHRCRRCGHRHRHRHRHCRRRHRRRRRVARAARARLETGTRDR